MCANSAESAASPEEKTVRCVLKFAPIVVLLSSDVDLFCLGTTTAASAGLTGYSSIVSGTTYTRLLHVFCRMGGSNRQIRQVDPIM